MKKILIMLLGCFLLCGLFVGCQSKEKEPTTDLTYDIDITLDGDKILGEQTTRFVNTFSEELLSVPFHLYANAYSEEAVHKAYGGILSSYGGIEISAVTVGGEDVLCTLDENKEYVFVPLSAKKGEEVTVTFTYTVTLPKSRLRFGMYNGGYYLSSFYPQLASFKDGQFMTDPFSLVGDPIFNEMGDYTVRFTCPSNLVVASGGKLSMQESVEETTTYTYQASNVRDFALAASADFNVLKGEESGTEIMYFSLTDEKNEDNLRTVCSAYKAFSESFGSTGLESYSVVVAPFDFSGMEFSGIVFVSSFAGEETESALIHETAHQWWYHLVGSDPIRQSALDEGLTSFTTIYYYYLTGDKAAFERQMEDTKKIYTYYETLQKKRKTGASLRADGTIYDYTTYQYTMLMYYKSCMMFNSLLELYGAEKCNACLRAYAEEYAHKTATFDDFIKVFNKTLATDISGLINGWLSDNATATTLCSV